jgi:hypothetical protein
VLVRCERDRPVDDRAFSFVAPSLSPDCGVDRSHRKRETRRPRGHRTEDTWGEQGFRVRSARKELASPGAPEARDPPPASAPQSGLSGGAYLLGGGGRFCASHAGGGGNTSIEPLNFCPGGTTAGIMCFTGGRLFRYAAIACASSSVSQA